MFETIHCANFRPLHNQQGMALLVVVGLLALMSLLGFFALDTTDVEMNIAGNYRGRQQAFFAAERAVEYAMTSESVYAAIGTGAVSLTDAQAAVVAADAVHGRLGTGEVAYLTTGPLPPESGSDPACFATRVYRINVVAEGPMGAMARIEAQVARVVPKQIGDQ